MYEPFDSLDLRPMTAEELSPPPLGLATMEPGPELARLLASIDSSNLASYHRVELIAAYRKMSSHFLAQSYREIALLFRDCCRAMGGDPEDGADLATTELAAALHLTDHRAKLELNLALALEGIPQVLSALDRGGVDLHRAQVLVDRTCHLPEADASFVIDQVIEEASHLTTGQLRSRVERLCYLANPEEARLRYGEAVKNRYVEVRGTEFGTATLQGRDLPPDRAEAAYRHLTSLARKLRKRGESRTMDQLRADLLLDLLLGDEKAH
ncbi:MAG: DUF222 domain-containing protein, partial [Acidimicrobiia bacterium]